jgi:hypothetical protein
LAVFVCVGKFLIKLDVRSRLTALILRGLLKGHGWFACCLKNRFHVGMLFSMLIDGIGEKGTVLCVAMALG